MGILASLQDGCGTGMPHFPGTESRKLLENGAEAWFSAGRAAKMVPRTLPEGHSLSADRVSVAVSYQSRRRSK